MPDTLTGMSYEKHSHKDPNFPITFHAAEYSKTTIGFQIHWHEHIELLYFINNAADMVINNTQISPKEGDVAVVNSNCMHTMPYKPTNCRYYCLIVDKVFFDSFFAPMGDVVFDNLIEDEEINSILDLIAEEMIQKNEYYKQAVKAYVSLLLSIMARKYRVNTKNPTGEKANQKLGLVREAIGYISIHYKESLSIDDLAAQVGFSKYHFCHTFKEITGQTAFDYINILRCNEAKRLISGGKYNVGEAALMSGFNNVSYFTRTYKKYMGIPPSHDMS